MVFILILLLIAAALGVLGTVLKWTAVLVLTLILTVAVFVMLAAWAFRRQMRRISTDIDPDPASAPGHELLPTRDDRY
jgi:membrane protein implicated in regulation of membrane protease activity